MNVLKSAQKRARHRNRPEMPPFEHAALLEAADHDHTIGQVDIHRAKCERLTRPTAGPVDHLAKAPVLRIGQRIERRIERRAFTGAQIFALPHMGIERHAPSKLRMMCHGGVSFQAATARNRMYESVSPNRTP
jgi:hypothetical protein